MDAMGEKLLDEPMLTSGDFVYDRTFQYMIVRTLRRQYTGTYGRHTAVMRFITQFVRLYVFFVLVVSSAVGPEKQQLTVNGVILIATALYLCIYVAEKLGGHILLLMAYCAVLAHATFYAVADDFGLFAIASHDDSVHDSARKIVLSVLIAVELLLGCSYVILHFAYPAVIARGWISAAWWFRIRRGSRSNTLTYVLFQHKIYAFWKPRRYTIEYVGGLDKDLRPHGFGMWKDSAYHGESLSGLWDHGIPIGPYTTREHGTGFSTEKLRIAYASIRGEKNTNGTDLRPSFKQLSWGVASVECSVAGRFFRFLPSVFHFFGQHKDSLDQRTRPTSAKECLPLLRTPLDRVFYRDVEAHASSERTKNQFYKECLEPSVLSSQQQMAHRNEALVYIHGVDTSLDYALTSVAQIMSLGDYPSYIHPFVFAWPSGGAPFPGFYQSLSAARDERSSAGLRDFLASIVDAGYSKVNVITHSMGTRCLFNCLKREYLRPIFQSTKDDPQSSVFKAKIVSITFCSPEYQLSDFVAADGVFDLLQQYCELITLYGDSHDRALMVSEYADMLRCASSRREPSLGRSMGKHIRDPSYPIPSECSCIQSGTFDASFENKDLSYAQVNLGAGLDNVTSFASSNGPSSQSTNTIPSQQHQPDSEPSPPFSSAMVRSFNLAQHTSCVPSYGSLESGQPRIKVYLDMDVIDTSFVDVNTGIRHSYYRLNSNIVDDIREIVLHKRRARARPGLMQQTGNVFIFLLAPSNVVAT